MKPRGSKAVLALALTLAAPGAPAGATPYSGTLGVAVGQLGTLAFLGAGSGVSTASLVALASEAFAGSGSVPVTAGPPLTAIGLKITGNGIGSFTGNPLKGPMPLFGVADLKGNLGGGPTTLFEIPLFTGHEPSSAAGTVAAGVGGSLQLVLQPAVYLWAFHTDWTAGAKTVTGLPYDYTYHLPAGKAASMSITYRYLNGTGMYTGTDSRTPGGLGQVTLISPTKVLTNLTGGVSVTVLVGTLTLSFVPEPGTLLLLGSGVAGLAALGGGRTRRR